MISTKAVTIRTVLFGMVLALALGVSAREARAQELDPLRLGIHPYLPVAEIHKRFGPLVSYLSSRLGRPVEIEISRDYDEQMQNVASGAVDLAFMGPASYVKLVDKFGPVPLLAVIEVNGKTSFTGIIAARNNSGFGGLADLKGGRFAFGDHLSTMAHYVPRYTLLKAGVDVKDLSGFSFLPNHDNIALGVLMGEFDAGALMEEVFEKYEPRGLVALARTPTVTEHSFVARVYLSPPLVEAVRRILLEMDDDPAGKYALDSIKSGATALRPVADSDYNSLREVLRELKKRGVE